uniref:Cingulin like 1 n=1 Tax=Nothobranchius furzeri TaxID=105023 RepID=A0A8C6LN86_NOTFU
MESYRVTGIPNSGSQRVYSQSSRSSRPQSNGAGTYGLSIRVQGIDGHPYVVLNNQDRGSKSYADPDSNGYTDTDGSFIENYQEYDFRGDKDAGSNDPFMEYRTQKMTHYPGPQNGISESQGKKPSTLLNFQKHPEILKPYDPESNALNLESFHSLPSRPQPQAETGNKYQNSSSKSAVHAPARGRSSSLDRNKVPGQQERRQPSPLSRKTADTETPKPKSQSQLLPQSQLAQPQAKPQSHQAQPQFKPYLTSLSPHQPKPTSKTEPVPAVQPQTSTMSSLSNEKSKTPASVSSTSSSLERNHRDPDVLPIRRADSSEPVLQSSSRSRHASLSSSNKTSADEQMEALYADTINRHENRRYIPFLPGSGRDIDTGSCLGVDELIEKFDGKTVSGPRRGRAGRRNRINPEDRIRSRSVDSALGLRNGESFMDEFSCFKGTSMEHVILPSQLRAQKTASSQDSWSTVVDGASFRATSAPGSPQNTISKGVGSIQGYRKSQSRASSLPFRNNESHENSSPVGKVTATLQSTSLSKPSSTADKKPSTEADVTPDLLRGQQELSQQTHEETAKQILFNYLKDGSHDNDEMTKRKVNLVFEKIQTLKSRATASAQGDTKQSSCVIITTVYRSKYTYFFNHQKHQADKRTVAGLKELQQELQKSLDECKHLKEKLAKTESDLQTSVEELFQVKMEREQYQTEIRDLQDQLSEMHDELDSAKRSAADEEKDIIITEIMQLKVEMQEVLLAKEEQEDVLRRRERELAALKGALKEEVAAHDQEVDKMKEQYEKEISRLQTSLEDAKQVIRLFIWLSSFSPYTVLASLKPNLYFCVGDYVSAHRLSDRLTEGDRDMPKLLNICRKEKKHLEESLAEIKEQEEEMSRANRALTLRLEDVQRNFAKVSSEHKELEERLQEEKTQKEQFKNMNNNIEDERRLLDQTVEKLQKEMNDIVEASQSSTRELQEQIDIYKEKNRRELSELQRLLKERGQELEGCMLTTKALQEELSLREEGLHQCERERDEAVLREKTLEKKVRDLEMEVEKNEQTKDNKLRQIKLMEERIAQLELDLEEERHSGDQLMDRIDRERSQVEQMRNELLQERGSRQDLECDKMALERQNKDLKSRVTHLEGSHKSNQEGLVSQLEARIQELEERLEGEERERANLQLANRRLERKVKEVMMQIEEEHHGMQDQKNQLNLRLKALKRQVDEAEEEIDRLEHGKKKLQRDLDEQQEANEQLQSQLKALRTEMSLDDDDDDDDDEDFSTNRETYFSSSTGYKRSSSQDSILSNLTL